MTSAWPKWLHKRSMVWISLAGITIFLKEVLPVSFWDQWYYHGFFTWIRQAYDFLLGWSPLPMIYILIAVFIVRTAGWMGQWRKGLVYQLSRLFGGVGSLVALFYITWGFNYGQVSLQERLGFNFNGLNQEVIAHEFLRATDILKVEAGLLPDRLTRDEAISALAIDDNDLRPDVEAALALLGLPFQGRVRVRQVKPDGFLLRWNTAGIYIPQSGEGHIDHGLLSVQKPFTIAHEMAHGYGVADEGACNFIAWLACSQSRDQWVRFGGALTYWRYTAAEMPFDSVSMVMNTLPPVVKRAIDMVKENDRKYPDIMPRARDAIYSSYLKRHGVKGGLRSYNEVVMMVQQYLASTSPVNRAD